MARISFERTAQSALPAPRAIVELNQQAELRGWKVAHVLGNQLDIRRGSQAALRLKGGWLLRIDAFPVVASVRFDSNNSGCTVIINSLDDLGPGMMLGMKQKYVQAVSGFGDEIEAIVKSIAPFQTPVSAPLAHCPAGHASASGARFCPTCGAAIAMHE